MKTTLALLATAFLVSCASSTTTAHGTGSTGDVKPYPKNTCIVSNNRLGSMGTPITRLYADQEVKFCCKPCIAKFEKDPQRYLPKLP